MNGFLDEITTQLNAILNFFYPFEETIAIADQTLQIRFCIPVSKL